jgi:hypothetical protein
MGDLCQHMNEECTCERMKPVSVVEWDYFGGVWYGRSTKRA